MINQEDLNRYHESAAAAKACVELAAKCLQQGAKHLRNSFSLEHGISTAPQHQITMLQRHASILKKEVLMELYHFDNNRISVIEK